MHTEFATTSFGTVSLGDLVRELDGFLPTVNVEFDFCGAVPDFSAGEVVASYRGWYDHLAIRWRASAPGGFVTADRLRERLRNALSETFMGYKGGQYPMGPTTPVWVDNWGDFTSTAIVGIEVLGGAAVILTKKVEI